MLEYKKEVPIFILEEKSKMKQCFQRFIECNKEKGKFNKECEDKYNKCIKAINSNISEISTF
jgi:hypothetical protein